MSKLVLVPLKKELLSLISVLNGAQKNEYGFFYKDSQFVVGGMGCEKFRLSVLKYKNLFNPKEIIAVGSCGALRKFKTLDIVEVVSAFERDPATQKVLSSNIDSNCKLFKNIPSVTCVSGDGSVLDKVSKEKLLEEGKFDVVTWETASFFKVMKDSSNILFTELRVVTDLADEKGVEDFQKNVSLGMKEIGLLLREYLK